MALDQAPIGKLTAELMDQLEKDVSDGEIGAIALVIEVMTPDQGSLVVSRFSDPRRHANLGLLEVAAEGLRPG